jgi:hypothetical protein
MGLTRFAGCHPGKLRHRAGFSIDPTVMLIVAVPMPGCRQISSGSLQGEFSHGLFKLCNGRAVSHGRAFIGSWKRRSRKPRSLAHAEKRMSHVAHAGCSLTYPPRRSWTGAVLVLSLVHAPRQRQAAPMQALNAPQSVTATRRHCAPAMPRTAWSAPLF